MGGGERKPQPLIILIILTFPSTSFPKTPDSFKHLWKTSSSSHRSSFCKLPSCGPSFLLPTGSRPSSRAGCCCDSHHQWPEARPPAGRQLPHAWLPGQLLPALFSWCFYSQQGQGGTWEHGTPTAQHPCPGVSTKPHSPPCSSTAFRR